MTERRLDILICNSLKLDPSRVKSIKIEFSVGVIPNAIIEIYPSDNEIEGIATILESYELQPINSHKHIATHCKM